jgi:uncharacterized SAM-binding protein YcdF (DUF218 family)
MFLLFKQWFGELLMPPSGLLVLALIGVAVLGRRPRLGRALVLGATLALWLLSMPIIAYWLYGLAEVYPALDLSRPVDAGAIIILGGGGSRSTAPEWHAGPMPRDQLWDRLAYGAYVARMTGLPILITDNGSSVQAMQAGLELAFGVKPRWIDADAFDTYQNARNSTKILHAAGIQRAVLITQSVHLPRSVAEFQAAGMAVVPAPVVMRLTVPHSLLAFIPDAVALSYSRWVVHEFIGRVAGGTLRHLRGESAN